MFNLLISFLNTFFESKTNKVKEYWSSRKSRKDNIFKNYKYEVSYDSFKRFKFQRIFTKQYRFNNFRYYRTKRMWRRWWRLINFLFWRNRFGVDQLFRTRYGMEQQHDRLDAINMRRYKRRRYFGLFRFRRKSIFWKWGVTRPRYPHDFNFNYNFFWKYLTHKYGTNYRNKYVFKGSWDLAYYVAMARKEYYRTIRFYSGKIGIPYTRENYNSSFLTEWLIRDHNKVLRKKRIKSWFVFGVKALISCIISINVLGYVTEKWANFWIKLRTARTLLIFKEDTPLYDVNRFFTRIEHSFKFHRKFLYALFCIAFVIQVCFGRPLFKNPTNNFLDVIKTTIVYIYIIIRNKLKVSLISIREDIQDWLYDVDIHYILIPIAFYWYIIYYYFLIFIVRVDTFTETKPNVFLAYQHYQEVYLFTKNYQVFYSPEWAEQAFYSCERVFTYKSPIRKGLRYYVTQICSFLDWLDIEHERYQNYYVKYFPNLNTFIRKIQLFHWEFLLLLSTSSAIYSTYDYTKFNIMRSIYKNKSDSGETEWWLDEWMPEFKEEPRSIAEYIEDFCEDLFIDKIRQYFLRLVLRFSMFLHICKVTIFFLKSKIHIIFVKTNLRVWDQTRIDFLSKLNNYITKKKFLWSFESFLVRENHNILQQKNKVDWILYTRDGEELDNDFLWWNCNTLDWDDERKNVLR